MDENNQVILNTQQLGNYKLNANYTYNDISKDLFFDINIKTKLFYENTNIDILYDENIIIEPLVKYGKYKTNINNIFSKSNFVVLSNPSIISFVSLFLTHVFSCLLSVYCVLNFFKQFVQSYVCFPSLFSKCFFCFCMS